MTTKDETKPVLNIDTVYAAAVADDQTKLSQDAIQAVFGTLAASTKGFKDRKAWEEHIRVVEDEYMEATQSTNKNAKTKGSKAIPARWKYRTYLPIAWSSAKSVCGTALANDVRIDADSRKTATELRIKEIRTRRRGGKTEIEVFNDRMKSASSAFKNLSSSAKSRMRIKHGLDTNNNNWS